MLVTTRAFSMLSAVLAVFLCGCSLIGGGKRPPVETIDVGACNPTPCAKITIENLPDLSERFSATARNAIRQRVDAALYLPIDDAAGEISLDRFVASVRDQYEDYIALKDAETKVEWNVTRAASVMFANDDIVSVSVTSVGYLGGAHGFNDTTLLVFNGATGAQLSWGDVISADSRGVFLKAAEAEFRRARGLRAGQSLVDAGFTFEDGSPFSLPGNFAVTDKGIVCHYNPYEVGPYVMGPTEFTVPMDVVGPSLNTNETALKGLCQTEKQLL